MNKTKILIVEDELLIAKNLANKLKKLDYDVIEIVAYGQAAIEFVSSNKPDLILMDIAIKGKIDGIETASTIRKNHDIPIIYLTAYADDNTLERASKTGSYGYIMKPFKERELHATIKMALNKHQEQSILKESLSYYCSERQAIYYDSLTNLPNQLLLRNLFESLLSEENNWLFSESEEPTEPLQANQKTLGVFYLDLDRFLRVRECLDNKQENYLIQSVAKRLTECTQAFCSEGTLVRLEQSQFAVLLPNIKERQAAVNFAQRLLQQINQPFLLQEKELFLTASIGISFYPLDNVEVEELLKQAKQAMIYAQQQGGNQYNFYTIAFKLMSSTLVNDLSLETDLHYALKRQELELFYQPQINLRTGQIVSVEALIRWNHPALGLMTPDKFIPLAEQNGLIEPIGKWVIQQACEQNKFWHQAGFDYLKIAINLSGLQVKQKDLINQLSHCLLQSDLAPQFLELELTEQILVNNVKANIEQLNLIKNLGIKIAIDDFGTGYSSLAYLQQFPLDILKIDRCFVSNIDKNTKNAVITKAIIQMAHQLGFKVIGEGVETEAELEFLVEHQCDEVQGYLFSVPLPADELTKLIAQGKSFPVPSSPLKLP